MGHPDIAITTWWGSAARLEGRAPSRQQQNLSCWRRSLLEAFYGGGFIVFHVEDGVEFGDLQQVVHFLGEMEQFEFAALILGGGEGADQFTDARAIDVIDLAEIEDDFFVALRKQIANGVAHHDAAFAKSDAAAGIHDGDSVDLPSAKFHAH